MPTSPPVLARCLPNRFTHASRTCITPHYVPSSSAVMTLTAMPPTRARAYHINIGIDGIAHHSPVVTQNKPVHRCTTAALPPPMPSMPVLSCTAARKYPALDSPRAFVHTVPAVCPLSPPLTLHRVHQRLNAVLVRCALTVRQLPLVSLPVTHLLISPGSPLQRPGEEAEVCRQPPTRRYPRRAPKSNPQALSRSCCQTVLARCAVRPLPAIINTI